ncbi:transposase, partial [Candidatus Poribacteria bacterium]|nr:transposase [Candidatus Poribacteria bacterium]
ELAAFVGLVPCERSTGDDINKGSITHLGNQTLPLISQNSPKKVKKR